LISQGRGILMNYAKRSTHLVGPEDETSEYYASALDSLFRTLNRKAYITVGRWSYAPNASNPLLFNPGPVGGLDRKDANFLNSEFSSASYHRAMEEFSFTKLLVDNDREIWFHFTNENPPDKDENQVYLGYANTNKGTRIVEVAASEVTPILVDQIIRAFDTAFEGEAGPTLYGQKPLRVQSRAISNTLEAAIFSVLNKEDCSIRHVTFMPVVVPSDVKSVVGIISINSAAHIKVAELEPLVPPFVEGIMAPFLFREIDEQRHVFSLRSAIAAIMSRNMSHNIGSHVLWHLSQQLRPKLK
jgi:hypothetical protein